MAQRQTLRGCTLDEAIDALLAQMISLGLKLAPISRSEVQRRLGLPGTGNFVGEFLILIGSFAHVPWITVIATTGLVFGSVYSLIMIHRAYFGPAKADTVLAGMDGRELIMVLGLAVLLILLGVYPQPFLDTSAATMSGVQQWLGSAFTQLASAR